MRRCPAVWKDKCEATEFIGYSRSSESHRRKVDDVAAMLYQWFVVAKLVGLQGDRNAGRLRRVVEEVVHDALIRVMSGVYKKNKIRGER